MIDLGVLRTLWTKASRRQRLLSVGAALLGIIIVSAVLISSLSDRLPDFRDYEAGPERKAEFFAYLRPLIEAGNARILEQRQQIIDIAEDGEVGWLERRRLSSLAAQYDIDSEGADDETLIDILLRRVDIVPLSLALAQAAKESGWGTSRFARQGYNLFGEWCYEPGCGLVPTARAEGRTHEVQAFPSPEHSVRSYLDNLNTNPSYREFRRERARLRAAGRPLTGLALAGQLGRYSERGDAYVRDIRQLIRFNKLEGDRPEPDA